MRRVEWLKWGAYALCAVIITVLQSQAGFFPKLFDASPLLAVPVIIALAMFEGETVGGIFGIVVGLIWDCGTGRVFGFNGLFLMIFAIVIGLLVKYLFRRSLFSALFFTAVITITHEFITWFFFCYMTGMRNLKFAFTNIMLPTVVLTLLFAIPIYYGAKAITRKLTFNAD